MSPAATRRLPGFMVFAFGVTASVLARRLPAQSGFGLGPAFLPLWTGIVLAACGRTGLKQSLGGLLLGAFFFFLPDSYELPFTDLNDITRFESYWSPPIGNFLLIDLNTALFY